MKVLVDTSVWSLALRRKDQEDDQLADVVEALKSLIEEDKVAIIGPIKQEMLSGIKSDTQFDVLKEKLSFFVSEPILEDDYITAAENFNICRRKGIQGSHIDFLIVAVASRLGSPIFTADKDFHYFLDHLPLEIYRPKKK